MRLRNHVRTFFLGSIVFVTLGWLAGCASHSGPMNPVEKAKATHELQRNAADCQRRFRESDMTDLEALECFIENYRQATVIHTSPMQCPSCYRNYGLGLRLLGMYYWEQRKDLEVRLEDALPSERPALESEIAKLTGIVRKHFRESNLKLESYVSTRQAIDARVYDWLSQQWAFLERYNRALQWLDLLEANAALRPDDDELVAKRRLHYERELQRQQLQKIRNSIDRESNTGKEAR